MALIVQTTTPIDGLSDTVDRILALRSERSVSDRKRKFDRNEYERAAEKICNHIELSQIRLGKAHAALYLRINKSKLVYHVLLRPKLNQLVIRLFLFIITNLSNNASSGKYDSSNTSIPNSFSI